MSQLKNRSQNQSYYGPFYLFPALRTNKIQLGSPVNSVPYRGSEGKLMDVHGPLVPILFYLNSIHYFSLPHSRYQSLLYTVYHITFPSFQVYHSKGQGYTYPSRIVRLIYYGCVSFSEYYCDYSSNMAFLIHFLNVFHNYLRR